MLSYSELENLRNRTINKLDVDAALDHIGNLIDESIDAQFRRGIQRALFLLTELEKRDLKPKQGALIEYFRANAWGGMEELERPSSWGWEHSEREQQVLALSRAVVHNGFDELDIVRRCQILTNRANQLHTMGRVVDAIEGWDEALAIIPKFAMALANRGFGLKGYGGLFECSRERAILLLHAHSSLRAAIAHDAIYEGVNEADLRRRFATTASEYAAAADMESISESQDLHGGSIGRNKAERVYRKWCLDRRLFLTPLNDLGNFAAAAIDDLILPAISESFNARPGDFRPPPVFGFFNQIKQEYVSARYMLFEGLNSTKLHFSDRDVKLFDTLDYPSHSFAIECVRTAYRIAYSLLDKVAFLVNHLWDLGKNVDRINFKNVWMIEGKSNLLESFKECPNWPLRGLYWLSKELFDSELKRVTSADARELHDIRNALEHRYLQVHDTAAMEMLLTSPASNGLSLAIDNHLLEAKALRMMKIARTALIQLSLAVGVEERRKADSKPIERMTASMTLNSFNDSRKRRAAGG